MHIIFYNYELRNTTPSLLKRIHCPTQTEVNELETGWKLVDLSKLQKCFLFDQTGRLTNEADMNRQARTNQAFLPCSYLPTAALAKLQNLR